MTTASTALADFTPWRLFQVEVRRVIRLSPSFVRITFHGPDLNVFADNGFDQRFKLVLPTTRDDEIVAPQGPDWYAEWRALPLERRPVIRTYTVRAVRAAQCEVDIDLVRHGDTGPASRFAGYAAPGDKAGLIGPDARYPGPHGGVEFRPPSGEHTLLLAGDETAAPAISCIAERLPQTSHGEIYLEVPHPADRLHLATPPGVRVTWLARTGSVAGTRLLPTVLSAADRLGAAAGPEALYAWLAGEAGVVRELRRYLITEHSLPREAVAFMGYWRLGRTESDAQDK